MNFYAICSALPKGENSTSSVFFEIVKTPVSQQQVQKFVRDFSSAFDDCLTTPRKAKLYGNTLMFSLPILSK